MILQQLAGYADRIDLPPPVYEERGVHWMIDLTEEGELEGFIRLGEANRGERMVVPARWPEGTPRLICDDARWVLGLGGADKKHDAFLGLVEKCAIETKEPALLAVQAFLERWGKGDYHDAAPTDLEPSHVVGFRVAQVPIVDLQPVQRFWAEYTMRGDAIPGTCLVSGEEGMVEKVLPGKIKGVPGAPGRGAAIVSAKHDATWHYLQQSSLNFPISRSAAERYTAALNHLLRDEKRRYRVGPVVYAFWTRRGEELEDFASFLDQPDPERVRELFRSPWAGAARHGVEEDAFYALALSGGPGRITVRDFLEATIPETKENLVRWFTAQTIPDTWGEEGKLFGIWRLARSAYFDADDMIPRVLTSLLETAIKGRRPSRELLARAVARNRAEGDVTHPRAALMKLILTYTRGEVVEDTAYQCGRLLAELEAIQLAAIPGANTTVVDRYFGTASTTPATAFGMLLKHSQPHLSKLKREKPGLAHILEERVGEVMALIRAKKFPKTLTLEEQASFALGYYQQRAATRAERKARKEARNSGATAEVEPEEVTA